MYAPMSLLVLGLVLGALTLVTVLESPQFSVAASVPGGTVLLLTATWLCLLAAAGQLWWDSRPRRAAVLLGLAGLSWLIPEWDSPNAPLPLYASALLLASATPALVLHGALAWRDSRLGGVPGRVTVASGYVVCLGLLGVVPALVLDPAAMGCVGCPDNPWLVLDGGTSLPLLERLGSATSAAWLLVAASLLAREVITGAGRSRPLAVQAPALGFLAVLIVREIVDLGWGLSHRSPLARVLWIAASLALVGVALGVIWLLVGRRRARRALGYILVDLARGQHPGLLRGAFAERLGDPTLELLYPTADGTLLDALGHACTDAASPGRRCTPIQYRGMQLGLLAHSSATSVPSEELAELLAATHLGLEHEGLTARALWEERNLRASGARLLAARDAERRRLERDLHDGAQQRLVGMALGLQLLARACPGPEVETARKHLTMAIKELRGIAQGLSPSVLVDAGLVAALHSLAETRDLEVTASDVGRFDTAAEATAYQIVETATRATPAGVTLECQDRVLWMRLAVAGAVPDLTPPADRVVTLGGQIAVHRDGGTTVVEVELPVELTSERSPEPPVSVHTDPPERGPSH